METLPLLNWHKRNMERPSRLRAEAISPSMPANARFFRPQREKPLRSLLLYSIQIGPI